MMYPTANAGTVIFICAMLFVLGFIFGFLITKASTLSFKRIKKKVRGFDTPAQMVSRRDVSLEEYIKNSSKHTSDGKSAMDDFKR